MDYFKCELCGKIFDEFEMNFKAAQEDKKCWCDGCRKMSSDHARAMDYHLAMGGSEPDNI